MPLVDLLLFSFGTSLVALASHEALAELEAIHGKAYQNYTEDHTKLFLTVQNKASLHARCY